MPNLRGPGRRLCGRGLGAFAAALLAVALLAAAGCSGERPTSAPAETPAESTLAEPTPAETPTAPEEEDDVADTPSTQEQARLDARLRDAAWANDVPRAGRLIARGADVNAKDETEQSAYLIATSEGYLDLLELTLRNGADVGSLDRFDGTGLIRAAERGHWDVVGRLVRAGVELDHVNNLGWTALHEAIVLGDGGPRYLATIRVLVAAGADLRLPSARDGVAPVEHARTQGQGAVVDLLRAALRADERESPRRAAAERRLLTAAESGDADAAAVAIRVDARLEVRDGSRRTPLLLSAAHDRVAVARLLVALGADPDALDDRHDTPWLVTGVTGSVPMLEVLLRADPDLTIRNRFGGLSVIPASERGHVDYVRRVVRTGIDVDHVNDLGWTALLEAVILGDGSEPYQEIVRILLRAGADPDIPDRNGVTALQHAETAGQAEVARILRRAG